MDKISKRVHKLLHILMKKHRNTNSVARQHVKKGMKTKKSMLLRFSFENRFPCWLFFKETLISSAGDSQK